MGVQLIYFKMLLLNDVQRINHWRLIRKDCVSPLFGISKDLRAAALSLFSLFLIHLACDPREGSPWGPKSRECAHTACFFLPANALPSLTLLSSAKALEHLCSVARPPWSPALHRPTIICIFIVTVMDPMYLRLYWPQSPVEGCREPHIDKLQCWFLSDLKPNTGDNPANSYIR